MPRYNMVNQSKKDDQRAWDKWQTSGAIGNANGKYFGGAYAFFDCNAPITQIAQEIPAIREVVNTPRKLELFLTENALFSIDRDDSELLEIARDAKEANIKYVLAARSLPNMTNRQTADELAAILNQAYNSPLYSEGEQFRGEVAYKERGRRYTFRE